jgi:hypothetical protein
MGVTVREKIKGSNDWWVFIKHHGQRKSKKIGDRKTAVEVAKRIKQRLVENEVDSMFFDVEGCGGKWLQIDRIATASFAEIDHAKNGKYVYAVVQGDRGPIKFGFTSNMGKRLAALQTANPMRLRVVWVKPGTKSKEKRIHKKLERYALTGEWFRPDKKVLDVVIKEAG